jgi:hypothetical protein
LNDLVEVQLVFRAHVQVRITVRRQAPVEQAPVIWTDIRWINVLILDRIDQGKH